MVIIATLSVYALLLIAGGLTGFYKAGSKPSLVAGLTSGALSLASAAWAWAGGPGVYLGLGLAIAMCIVFGMRLRKTGKFMPSGLLLISSGAVAAILAFVQFASG